MTVIAGMMTDFPVAGDVPGYKGRIVIEWPYSSSPLAVNQVLPGVLTSVRDADTGDLIPAAKITVHVGFEALITADVAVFLDRDGGIIHDPNVIWRDSDAPPATFTFLVAGMRNGA